MARTLCSKGLPTTQVGVLRSIVLVLLSSLVGSRNHIVLAVVTRICLTPLIASFGWQFAIIPRRSMRLLLGRLQARFTIGAEHLSAIVLLNHYLRLLHGHILG